MRDAVSPLCRRHAPPGRRKPSVASQPEVSPRSTALSPQSTSLLKPAPFESLPCRTRSRLAQQQCQRCNPNPSRVRIHPTALSWPRRPPHRRRRNSLATERVLFLLFAILALFLPCSSAIAYTPAPSSNLDLSGVGRVVLTGNFDTISLYEYQGQNEGSSGSNGSQALLQQLPNGAFDALLPADAMINALVPFVRQNGDLAGIVVGGNFTSFAGTEAQGVALYDPSSNKITPLPGLTGSVSALYCNSATDTVYVGGDFRGGNSTNAIAWVGMTGWANTPFAGFNGPVNSIVQAPGGNIVFGGSFTGLANTTLPTAKDQQVINLSTANISTSANSSTPGFADPHNIICKTDGTDGAGNTWLLPDNTPGYWRADMAFGYRPTKLRLWNTHQDGRGTKTFRVTALPINGIMNLTYTDPVTNLNQTCDARCPLPSNGTYQDFHFINVIGMNSIQLDISEWYGAGAGLNGIELFQDDIYAYAVESNNEPACTQGLRSASTSQGPWTVTPAGQTTSTYLTAVLNGPNINANTASVTFEPDIKQSGNYSVTIFTPGCQQDKTCGLRGMANVTGRFSTGGATVQSDVYQTNDYDKYDQIFHGYIDAGNSNFRPTVTLSPRDDQKSPITLVALRVRFELLDASSSGLNGLYEFNPNQAAVETDFSKSKVDAAGMDLSTGADITSLAVIGDTTFVAGNFSNNRFQNIFSMENGNSSSLPKGGLNGAVASMLPYGNFLFVGGNFTDTASGSTPGTKSVAAFDTGSQTWIALGNGVNGPVTNLVPLELNITDGNPETCITVNGPFSQVQGSGNQPGYASSGLAIWVPSRNDWLHNLNVTAQALTGQLTAATNTTGQPALLAGSVSSQGLSLDDAVELSSNNGRASLSSLGLQAQSSTSSSSSSSNSSTKSSSSAKSLMHTAAGASKAADTLRQNFTGVITGVFAADGGRNLTVLAGQFQANATDGSLIQNLAIVNNSANPPTIAGMSPGLDDDSMFLALYRSANTVFAGGSLTGTINQKPIGGLVIWDLDKGAFASPQPPPLSAGSTASPEPVAVRAIAMRPNTADLFVGGTFDGAAGLGCQGVCVYSGQQWQQPGSGFSGNVTAMLWQGNDQLLVAGELRVQNNLTNLASYDAGKQIWSIPSGAQAGVPGPITALTPASADASSYWVAGLNSTQGDSSNATSYLVHYDGSSYNPVPQNLAVPSYIRGLSMMSLTQSHDDTHLVPGNMALLITGSLTLPSFGNASAALFNGTDYTPFVLANLDGQAGSLGQVVTEQQQSFNSGGSHLAVGYIVLISLAIALALMALLITAGFLLERRRRRAEGYRPAPTNYFEKTAAMGRIPPERLFGTLSAPTGPRV